MSFAPNKLPKAHLTLGLVIANGATASHDLTKQDTRRKIINCVSRVHFGGTLWRVAAIALELKSSSIDTIILMPIDKQAEFRKFLDFHQIPYIECRLRAAGRMGRWQNNLRFLLGLVPEIRQLVRVFRDQAPDIVHVNGATNLAPLVAAALTGSPLLWHWNDMMVPRWMAEWLKLFSLLLKAHVVVASSPVAHHYRLDSGSCRYLGVLRPPLPPENLTPVLNSLATDPLPVIPKDFPVLGFVSNLLKAKGAMEFVETVAALRDQGIRVSGVMVGGILSGHEAFYEKMLCRIQDLGIGQQIILTGYRYDVMNLMRRFDVLLYPSHTEASPIVVTQALATGVPIVATGVGDIPEKLAGLNMPIVSIGDVPAMAGAVEQMLKMDGLARRLYQQTAEARSTESHSVGQIASRHIALYDAIDIRHHTQSAAPAAPDDLLN